MSQPAEASTLEFRIVSVPKLHDDLPFNERPAASRRRMVPAVTMVHAFQPTTCVSTWLRAEPNGRAAVLVGGIEARRFRPRGRSVPTGARAVSVKPAQRDHALGRFPAWERANLSLDCTEHDRELGLGLQIEDLFALLPDRPMGIIVIARPHKRDALPAASRSCRIGSPSWNRRARGGASSASNSHGQSRNSPTWNSRPAKAFGNSSCGRPARRPQTPTGSQRSWPALPT